MPQYQYICPTVSCKYGAPMGRASKVGTIHGLRLRLLPMAGDGYDVGGAYWGLRLNGERIYVAYSKDKTTYLTFDAKSLLDAMRQLRDAVPGCTLQKAWDGKTTYTKKKVA